MREPRSARIAPIVRGDGLIFVTAAATALIACVLFAPALFDGKVLSPSATVDFSPPFAAERPSDLTRLPNQALNDNTILFEDHLSVARSALGSGRLPLWDPFIGAGRPLGAAQGAPFFPTSWLAYLLPFWHSFAWIALLKLMVAGLGMALLSRELALGRTACVVAALSYAFSSLFIAFLGHGQTSAFLLVPWSLLAAERLVLTGAVAAAIGLGAAVGLCAYNGHPESCFLAAVVSFGYLAYRLLTWAHRPAPHADLRSRLFLAGGALLVAGGLAAFDLVSLLEVIRQARPLSQPPVEHGSLSDLIVGATMPEFWGRPDKTVFNQTATPIFTHVFFGRPYIGVAPGLLAIVGCLRRPRSEQWFFLAVGLGAVLVSLGGEPLTVLRDIPGFAQVNAFEYLWLVTLSGSVLAGFGVHRVLTGDRQLVGRAGGLLAVAGIAVVVVALHLRPGLRTQLEHGLLDVPTLRATEDSADAAAAGSLVRFVVLALALAAILVAHRRAHLRRWTQVALVGIVALDLVLIDHGYWPMLQQRDVAPPLTNSLRIAKDSGPRWRLVGLGVSFTPDLAERYGVTDIRSVDLPLLTRYSRLFEALGGVILPGFGETLVDHLGPSQLKLLDLFSARWVIAGGAPAVLPSGWKLLTAQSQNTLIENRQALPRAFVAYGNQGAHGPSDAVGDVTRSSVAGLYDRPVIEGAPSRRATLAPTEVSFRHSAATRVVLSFDAKRNAWLVLGDTYYPGWQASIDGRRADIHPANVDFQAVRVPAGRHVVTFNYRPTGVKVAFWFSVALSALILLGVSLSLVLARWPAWRGGRWSRRTPARVTG